MIITFIVWLGNRFGRISWKQVGAWLGWYFVAFWLLSYLLGPTLLTLLIALPLRLVIRNMVLKLLKLLHVHGEVLDEGYQPLPPMPPQVDGKRSGPN